MLTLFGHKITGELELQVGVLKFFRSMIGIDSYIALPWYDTNIVASNLVL